MKKIILLVFFAVSLPAVGQSLVTKVVDENNVPLDYFNMFILEPADSSLVACELFYKGVLEYHHNLTGEKILQLTCLGYEDFTAVVNFNNPQLPEKIVMRAVSYGIGEAVVEVRRAAVRNEKGKTIVQVSGSQLVHLFDVTSILSRAPGVKATDDGITIFGKGAPKIFIDGREATYTELKMIQPADILTIEIDRNPSSRYESSYKAVMRVRTKRASQGVSGRVNAGIDVSRRTTPTAGGQLQISTPKLYSFFGTDLAMPIHITTEQENQAIIIPQYAMTDSTTTKTRTDYRMANFLYNSVWTLNARSSFSWQYRLGYTGNKETTFTQESIRGVEIPTQYIVSNKNSTTANPTHKFNLGYQLDIDSVRKLELFADYYIQNKRGDETVLEHDIESHESDTLYISNRSNARVATARAEYSATLAGAKILLGARYGQIGSTTNTEFIVEKSRTRMINNTFSLYATLGREYGAWGYQVGLRYEFSGDELRLTNGKTTKRFENNLFPSVDIHTNNLWQNLSLAVNYTNKIERPPLWALDPSKSYVNRVTIRQGNPDLKSSIAHMVSLNATIFEKFSLDAEYGLVLNTQMQTGLLAEDKKTIIYTPVNVARGTYTVLMAGYSTEWGRIALSASAGAIFNNYRIPYMDGYYDNKGVNYQLQISPSVKISDNSNFSCNFDYSSREYQAMTVFEPSYELSLNFSQYLFKKRIQIVASAQDLLKSSRSPFTDKIGYYISNYAIDSDNRRFRLSVRYIFNNFKSKYRSYGDSQEQRRVN
ncbi:putative TonB-dependent receptor [Mucinivorans hirudinis]|uniref:Putative TonB-dependent receptor n=1 Tax=Mucinivorans hirudinis TaxID=1433126 RepID=A0A060RDC4_9BACT|nr:putative TonB-dependent receptor [Mucinivorans hirudinis]